MKDSTLSSLIAYRDEHRPTGGFLQALLSGDLPATVFRADEENLRDLREIVEWAWNELPGNAWGSSLKVAQWINSREEDACDSSDS